MTVAELIDALMMSDPDAIVLGAGIDSDYGYREIEVTGWSKDTTDVVIIRLRSGKDDVKIPTGMIRAGWRPPKKPAD